MKYLRNKTILIISPEAWSQLHVSKHHYAKHLTSHNTVYFLNPPSDRFKITSSEEKGLYVIDNSSLRGVHYLPPFLSQYITAWEISQLEKKLSTKFHIIWSFDPSRLFNLKRLKQKLRIAHLVDLNQTYERNILLKTADLGLTVTNSISKKLSTNKLIVHNIGHACAQHISTSSSPDPKKLPGVNKVKAIYIGNLIRDAVDWEVLYQTAKKYQEVDFIYFGSDEREIKKLNENKDFHYLWECYQLTNTHFPGRIVANQIPQTLLLSNIQLIAFKTSFHKEQTNSHKILEYMQSGRVTVATYTEDFDGNDELMVMSEHNHEYVSLFNKVLTSLDQFNSDGRMAKRKKLAQENSYEKKIELIDHLIASHVKK
ncbi:MAG: hypothetical protein R8N23_17660 [Reichenbachiella sp.]|uniref:hypothetical protein n=1 Tax=Reichenbachiella sp. TaxID=2184521 RepID=UPI002966BEF1|nr:hypothetical protein [Reichenbachiella sp.]MDW3211699.1 hypothetical protein [Reichenbachiella sp.]